MVDQLGQRRRDVAARLAAPATGHRPPATGHRPPAAVHIPFAHRGPLPVYYPGLSVTSGARRRRSGCSPPRWVRLPSPRTGRWRTLLAATHETHLTFSGALGATYRFRVQADGGPFATATTVVPTGTRITRGHFSRGWHVVSRRGAWQQHAIQTTTPRAAFTLRYVGGALEIIGETTSRGGVLRVTVDGHTQTLRLHSRALRRRRVLYSAVVTPGVHHLRLVAVRGLVALEGLAIASRTG